eukprot:1156369-Pelagomonas_calceolata.AAC.11
MRRVLTNWELFASCIPPPALQSTPGARFPQCCQFYFQHEAWAPRKCMHSENIRGLKEARKERIEGCWKRRPPIKTTDCQPVHKKEKAVHHDGEWQRVVGPPADGQLREGKENSAQRYLPLWVA